jgi:Co/Zn/Cd efflux system component
MELHLLLITFLIWFSCWTFLESIIKQHQISNQIILKVSFIGIICSLYLYQEISDTKESNE